MFSEMDMEMVLATMVDFPSTQEGRTTMTDVKKNFRHSYSDYATLAEAEQFAKRATAKSFSVESVWQRISETVVPAIDVTINAVDVSVAPVAVTA